MQEQQKISFAVNESIVGKTVKVLIDEKDAGQGDLFIGRTQGDAPEVDGSVYVSGKNIKVGMLCDVEINDALEYDLAGVSA